MTDETTAGTSVDDELVELQLEAEKATLRATIAAQNKAARASPLGDFAGELSSLSDASGGTVQVSEGTTAAASRRVHHTIHELAKHVASSVKAVAPAGARIAIVSNQQAIDAFWVATQVKSALDDQKSALDSFNERLAKVLGVDDVPKTGLLDNFKLATEPGRLGPEPSGQAALNAGINPGAAAGSALSAAVQLLGLIQSDYTVTPMPVRDESNSLLRLCAVSLANERIECVLPELGSPSDSRILDSLTQYRSCFQKTLSLGHDLQGRVSTASARLELTQRITKSVETAWTAALTKNDDKSVANSLAERLSTLYASLLEATTAAAELDSLATHGTASWAVPLKPSTHCSRLQPLTARVSWKP